MILALLARLGSALLDWRVILAILVLIVAAAIYVLGIDRGKQSEREHNRDQDEAARAATDARNLTIETCIDQGGEWIYARDRNQCELPRRRGVGPQ